MGVSTKMSAFPALTRRVLAFPTFNLRVYYICCKLGVFLYDGKDGRITLTDSRTRSSLYIQGESPSHILSTTLLPQEKYPQLKYTSKMMKNGQLETKIHSSNRL